MNSTSLGDQTARKRTTVTALWLVVGGLLICGLLLCIVGLVFLVWDDRDLAGLFPTQASFLAGGTTGTPTHMETPVTGTGLQVGEMAPGFTLESVGGEQVSLSDYRGKPVLINFWATWCEPCLDEIPLLNTRYEQYAPDLVILAVDQGDSLGDINRLILEEHLTLPILLDPDYSIGDLYLLEYYPTSIFVDGNGVIRAVVDYSLTDADLDTYLSMIGIPR